MIVTTVSRNAAAIEHPARVPAMGSPPSDTSRSGRAPCVGTHDVAPVSQWDLNLSRDELNRLSPRDKRTRLGASLQRKLAIIEAAAADAPESGDAALPTSRTGLREWEDRARRLWSWSDRRAERPDGPHAAALARFDIAVSMLRVKSRMGKPASMKEQSAAKDLIINALTRQNAALIIQLATRGPALDDVRR